MSYISKLPPKISEKLFKNYNYETIGGVTTPYLLPFTPMESLETHYCTSVKTPGFKYLKKKDLPVNPFAARTRVRYDSYCTVYNRTVPGVVNMYTSGTKYLFYSLWVSVNTAPWLHGDDSKADAIQKALRKAKNLKVNLPLAATERMQTARLLINSVNRLVGFASNMRRGNFQDAAERLRNVKPIPTFRPDPRHYERRELPKGDLRKQFKSYFPKDRSEPLSLDEFASVWKEAMFGWVPLLSDIKGASELLAESVAGGRPLSVTSSSVINETILQKRIPGGALNSDVDRLIVRQSKAKVKLNFQIDEEGTSILSQTGITDPLSWAWQAMPYSFVLDWFLPVGNYLEALGADSGLKFVDGWITYKTTATVTSTIVKSIYSVSSANPQEFGIEMVREKLYAFPTPSLPTFSFGLTPGQGTSALALLTPFFKSKTVTPQQFSRRLGKPRAVHEWYG